MEKSAPAATEPAQNTPEPSAEEPQSGASDKPFDDEPFDAGVEADEKSDPKKYIEQLTGKLGQSLRKYNEDLGHPDFELEKFAINSLLSATHTSEMSQEDQDDIIDKVKSSGNKDDNKEEDNGDEEQNTETEPNNETPDIASATGGEANGMGGAQAAGGDSGAQGSGVSESDLKKKDEPFLIKAKKLSIFAPEGSEEAKENIKAKLSETFQQNMSQPETNPVVKPAPVKTPEPIKQPSRKNRPFSPTPSVTPIPPKAETEEYMSQVANEAETAEKKPDTMVMAKELASISKNVNDMVGKMSTTKFFKKHGITDSDQITDVIAKASELIKNR